MLYRIFSIYGQDGLKEMVETILIFVTECVPRLAAKISGGSEKLSNITDLMQKKYAEVLDCINKDIVSIGSLTHEEFTAIFTEELSYLLSPRRVRSTLLPYFINHSLYESTLSSVEETAKKSKKKVTFALD